MGKVICMKTREVMKEHPVLSIDDLIYMNYMLPASNLGELFCDLFLGGEKGWPALYHSSNTLICLDMIEGYVKSKGLNPKQLSVTDVEVYDILRAKATKYESSLQS